MRPLTWNPPIDLSETEEKIIKRIKRAKLFVFLRETRHLLFNEAFQEELASMYADATKGHPPVPPAQLALTIILQAYTKASDAEAIEALTMDRRWQLVIDCLEGAIKNSCWGVCGCACVSANAPLSQTKPFSS